MPEDYEVQPGDCLSSIAYENGFFWQTLWNLPANSDLKSKRKNPNVLMTGDVVHIPDLTVKQQPGATETRHKFVLKGVPEFLRMKLLDAKHQPRPNLDYVIVIDGNARRGQTDGTGELKESIPPNAKSGTLTFAAPWAASPSPGTGAGKPTPRKSSRPANQVINLQLGGLNPITSMSGFKARLANVGAYRGPLDDNLDDATTKAIKAFQTKKGLPVTGLPDDATKAKLQDLHGH
jgi:N-acetylmuramoyl-L-alanine amidase